MKISLTLGAAALAASFCVSGAWAQATAASAVPPAPGVSKARELNQQRRINDGRKSDELTRRETVRLRTEQRLIDRQQQKYKSDGKVTKTERKRLDRAQDAANRDIMRQRSDEQTPASK